MINFLTHTSTILKSKGINNIYLMTKAEINLCLDCYVDGTHPSDLGMEFYASAYEKKLGNILNEHIGNFIDKNLKLEDRLKIISP